MTKENCKVVRILITGKKKNEVNDFFIILFCLCKGGILSFFKSTLKFTLNSVKSGFPFSEAKVLSVTSHRYVVYRMNF